MNAEKLAALRGDDRNLQRRSDRNHHIVRWQTQSPRTAGVRHHPRRPRGPGCRTWCPHFPRDGSCSTKVHEGRVLMSGDEEREKLERMLQHFPELRHAREGRVHIPWTVGRLVRKLLRCNLRAQVMVRDAGTDLFRPGVLMSSGDGSYVWIEEDPTFGDLQPLVEIDPDEADEV